MMHDAFFEDIEKMFEWMDREFHRMEQSMFANMGMGMAANAPVHQFQIVIEQQPAPDLPAPDFPTPDFPKPDAPPEDFPSANLSENLKQIPYEGPAENS